MNDSPAYRERRAFFDRLLTVYGRKPVLEVLQNPALQCHALHLADSNREQGIVRDIRELAASRGIDVQLHDRQALSRISRNGRQDQGVAIDVLCPAFQQAGDALTDLPADARLLALDGISNPQNLGMIIRSAAAGNIDGILYARRGNAALGPLVIKASAGTLYRAPLLLCEALPETLRQYRDAGVEVCTLAADARESLFEFRPAGRCVYVLGNETDGVSGAVQKTASRGLSIPMRNGVESLNVAVTASLIAYAGQMEI
ncbi:TrmH family RNA methyltransferase [Parahaliea aestuarii]|uniref:RNA methyltransferase n=1 Tax=Parahaliea aestuarii TaxID=1852021 RepID=A0A5C8ZZM2_9GAMM|nr:RNA methyltransferase [Parahaliea aestuarii]TXS93184.1 RNA methyltransferase [Parahaliea aestuarii]